MHWVNQPMWDTVGEGRANSLRTGEVIDLRLDWGAVKTVFENSGNADVAAASARVDKDFLHRDVLLSNLDPTQEAFANRFLKWVRELIAVYKHTHDTGEPSAPPFLRRGSEALRALGSQSQSRRCCSMPRY